jgi:hypothetical protein
VHRALVAAAGPVGRLLVIVTLLLPGLVGLLLVSYGAWLVYPPAGYVTAGALLLADRVATARRTARGGESR